MNENEITIDTQFKDLLPPLDKVTYQSLEESIILNGCMYPIVTWNGILIDGHNRFAICTEHKIPFEVTEKAFNSREDVIIWIINNQVARRNLTPMQLIYFRGLHYNTVKGQGRNPNGINQYSEVDSDNPSQPKSTTADELSKQYKVHRDTIYTDAKATNGIDAIGNAVPEAKAKILSGDVPINKKELQRLATADEAEIQDIANDIAEGSYAKTRNGKPVENPGNPANSANSGSSGYTSASGAGAGTGTGQSGQPNHPSGTTLTAGVSRAYQAFAAGTENADETQSRQALREFIDELELLYSRL